PLAEVPSDGDQERGGEEAGHPCTSAGDPSAASRGDSPPNRLSRFWYSMIAVRRWFLRKSGPRTSETTSSAEAICQRGKFDTRSSPPVRTTRSGSGCPAV